MYNAKLSENITKSLRKQGKFRESGIICRKLEKFENSKIHQKFQEQHLLRIHIYIQLTMTILIRNIFLHQKFQFSVLFSQIFTLIIQIFTFLQNLQIMREPLFQCIPNSLFLRSKDFTISLPEHLNIHWIDQSGNSIANTC